MRVTFVPSEVATEYTKRIIRTHGPEFTVARDGCPQGFNYEPCLWLESCMGQWQGYIPIDELLVLRAR